MSSNSMGISRDIGDSLALLILCGICICYLPIFLNWRIKEQYIFDFDEDVHTNSLIASIAVAFPLMVDVIFNRDLPWKVILSRWMLLSSLIIPNLCDYLAIQSSSPEFASALIVCNKRARQMLCNGGLVTIYDRTVPYQRRVRVFFVCVGILANMCQCFVPFLHHSEATQSLQIIETICRVGGVIGMLFFCSYYCYCVLQRKETLTFLAKYCLVESVLLVVNIFAKGIYRSTLPLSGSNYSYQSYVGLIWIDTVTAVLAFVIPNRMAIEEASKVRLMYQAQKSFVRYVSHEVRTPLNTLSMGLDLLFSHDIFKITEEDINSGVFLNPSTLSSHTDLNVASVDASSSLPATEERKDQQHSFNKVTKLDKINDALDIVEAMRQSCETAICTLNDVLLYDKIEEGKMVLEKRKISVIQLLSQTIKPFYIQSRSNGINLSLNDKNFDTLDSCVLEVDINKISQVIRNFLSNALKFTSSRGSVTLRAYRTEWCDTESRIPKRLRKSSSNISHNHSNPPIEVPNGSVLRIEVIDSGPGLSEEDQQRLFHETIQFNAADMQAGNGSGFGLYISRTIVEHHEGRIGVTAELGVGSTFYFEIHLQSYDLKEKLSVQDSGVELSDSHTHILDPNPLPHHPATTMPSSSSSSPNNLFQRVLIVDDSKLNRKMLYRQLKHNFVDIVEAEDGLEGVRCVEESMKTNKPYDLIFMDNVMPNLTGPNATRMIRINCGYQGMIVALTGSVLDDDVTDFMTSGATSIVPKPMQQTDLERVLTELHEYRKLENKVSFLQS